MPSPSPAFLPAVVAAAPAPALQGQTGPAAEFVDPNALATVFIPDTDDGSAPDRSVLTQDTLAEEPEIDLSAFASSVRERKPSLIASVSPLALAGVGLSLVGLVGSMVAAFHFIGFGIAVFGLLFTVAGFFARSRSKKMGAIAAGIALIAVLATTLAPHSSTGEDTDVATAPASVAATDAAAVALSVQGADGTTIGSVRYTFDRADGTTTEAQNPPVLPWTKNVNVSTSRSDVSDSYSIRATPDAKKKKAGALVCSITIGQTVVALNISQPGKPLVCRYTGTAKEPVAAGTKADVDALVKSLQPVAAG